MLPEKPKNIDAFIAQFPIETQLILKKVRAIIKQAAPEAEEKINYGIPTFSLYGNLVHFSAYKNHIGFYPGADVIKAFTVEIALYKNAKGSVQFPLNQPIPYDLINKITKYKVEKNLQKAALKQSKVKKQ